MVGVGCEGESGELGVGEGVVEDTHPACTKTGRSKGGAPGNSCKGSEGDKAKCRFLDSHLNYFGGFARDDSFVLMGEVKGDAGDEGFVTVADDGVDFGEDGELFRGALGVAARDDHAGLGVLAADAAEKGAGLAVGLSGDAAGIYNDDMGGGRFLGRQEPALA